MDTINNGGYFPSASGAESKASIIKKLQDEAAMANGRQLVQKLNYHCFEKCVPTPGTSLSKKEESCLTQCMEKYMATWNAVSRQYVERLQKLQAQGPAGADTFAAVEDRSPSGDIRT